MKPEPEPGFWFKSAYGHGEFKGEKKQKKISKTDEALTIY